MARPIDEKIVRMSLDNSDFKRRIQETVQSFDLINKGISGTNNADLSRIAEGISSLESRVSVAGAAIASIINNLVTGAIAKGRELAGALIDPLVEGGKKRALNIEQAQFQFQGLGMDVEKTMESALAAVQGTAYGLDEAAVVASQFGATGMRAGDEMTAALRGISGVAAMTGSSYSDIGSIFTTVAGNGRLMGSELLRLSSRGVNAAATLAKSMGITEEEVRSMVSKGKISFEMFAEAMNDAFGEHATRANETYTGSLSNVRAALARIGAAIYAPEFTNKRDIFNAVTPKIDEFAAAIKPLIEVWTEFNRIKTDNIIAFVEGISFTKFQELGGTANLVEAFWNVLRSGMTILKAVSDGFSRVFPPATAEQFVRVTEIIKNFTENLTISGSSAEKLTTVFQGIFSVFSTAWEISVLLGKALLNLIPSGLGGSVLDIAVSLAEMAIAFNQSVREGNGLTAFVEGLGGVLGDIVQAIFDVIRSSGGFAKAIYDNLGGAIAWLVEKLAPVGSLLKEIFGDIGGDDILGAGFLIGLFKVVQKVIGYLEDTGSGNILDGFKSTLEGIGDSLNNFATGIKYANLTLIAISVGILAASLKTLEGINAVDISKGVLALGAALTIMMGGMMLISKFNITGGLRASATLIALAIAVNIMATALKRISDLDTGELIRGVGGLVSITGALTFAIIGISKLGGRMGTSSLQLLALATAVVILTSAIERMTEINTANLFISIGALSVILLALAGFLKIVDRTRFGMGSALGILAVSAAIQVMVTAIDQISGMDIPSLVKGLSAMAVILAQIAIFSRVAGGLNLTMAGIGMIGIATAMNMLMKPIGELSNMSWTELVKGLGGMAVALAAVAGAALLMNGGLAGAAAFILMGVALKLIIDPIETLSKMSWQDMLLGMIGLVGALALVAGVATLLSPAAANIAIFGAALLILGVAMLAAGGGIALFGLGLAALATLTAASIGAIIASLALLLKGLATLIPGTVDFVVELSAALLNGLRELVPPAIDLMVELTSSMLNVLDNNLPEFIAKGGSIVVKFLEGIENNIEPIANAATSIMIVFMDTMTTTINERSPLIRAAFMALLAEILVLFVQSGVDIVTAMYGWIPGVTASAEAIGSEAEKYIRENFDATGAGKDKGNDFNNALDDTKGGTRTSGTNVGTAGKDGANSVDFKTPGSTKGLDFSNSLNNTSGNARTSGKNIGTAGQLGANSIDLRTIGSTKGLDFANGLGGQTSLSRTSGTGIANAGKTGVESVSLNTSGVNFARGFSIGMSSMVGSIATTATSLASAAVRAINNRLDIRSPSRVAFKDGAFFGEGLALGIKDKIRRVSQMAKNLADAAQSSLYRFLQGFASQLEDNEFKVKAVIDYDDPDPKGFGDIPEPRRVPRPTTSNNSEIIASRDRIGQNGNNSPREEVDLESRSLLRDIKEGIVRLDTDRPMYMIMNDKAVGKTVTKYVEGSFDLSYMKSERGLADA